MEKNNIHPTSIISSKAKLGENIRIGAYTIIEDDVVIGDGTVVGSHCYIHSGTIIGKNNRIYSHVCLGGEPQDVSFDSNRKTQLIIGDENTFREFVNIHRSTSENKPTIIGNRNYLMGTVHLGHDCEIGDNNILVQNCIFAGHVKIDNHVLVSGLVAVHQFCHIGDYAMIGGVAKIVQDVPPFMMADGNPAEIVGINVIGLRRANFSSEQRKIIKEAYKILFRKGFPIPRAIEELKTLYPENSDVQLLVQFIQNSKRGIISGAKG